MDRCKDREIMDREDLPEELLLRIHRDLDRVQKVVGNTAALISALRRDSLPVRRVLDVGCGYGGVLREVRRRLGVEVIGVDLRPPKASAVPFPILRADATRDPLPEADVAISALVAHHLSADELIAVIQNVGRSCRRFVVLDLVRSRLPLVLFQTFVAPFVSHENRADGRLSIRRAYTPDEFRAVVGKALAGTGATFRHSVAPLYVRQMIDISYSA
jgi:SAM-dependent methyltransferase